MLETANREIREAAEADERRRRDAGRLPSLVAALDELLFELEELIVQDVAVAPVRCRERAAELIAEATRQDSLPELPESVPELMERVYDAQDVALIRRRRAGWGLDEAPPDRARP